MLLRFLLAMVLIGPASSAEAKKRVTANTNIDMQVRLARANASPGPIDGKAGKNQQFAIKSFQRMTGLEPTGRVTKKLREALGNEPSLMDYTITGKDLAGPFLSELPTKLEELATLDHLGYTSVIEALAEKFHMSDEFLRALNPRARYEAGETIKVVNIGDAKPLPSVHRIEVDKSTQAVFVYLTDDRLIAAYPATIGISETPSPEGQRKVTSVSKNPTYVYDPSKLNFKGVETQGKLEIRPGPNNPVGLVWIALDAPSYGIHGSPSRVPYGSKSRMAAFV